MNLMLQIRGIEGVGTCKLHRHVKASIWENFTWEYPFRGLSWQNLCKMKIVDLLVLCMQRVSILDFNILMIQIHMNINTLCSFSRVTVYHKIVHNILLL